MKHALLKLIDTFVVLDLKRSKKHNEKVKEMKVPLSHILFRCSFHFVKVKVVFARVGHVKAHF